jgi:3-phenylpropionate/cinnamic acid dioxygenase small subunit
MSYGDDYFMIINLLNRYSDAVDRGDFEMVGALFREADIYFPGSDEIATRANSDQNLGTSLSEWTRIYPDTGNPKTRHLCVNPIVDFETATRARVQSYFVVFQATEKLPLQAVITGTYRDVLIKVDETWKFIERREIIGQFGDLSAHLLKDPVRSGPAIG